MAERAQRALKQAIEAHGQGDLRRAEQLYRRLLKSEPKNARVLLLLGSLLCQLGAYAEGAELLSRSAALDPKNPAAQAFLGGALHRLGRAAEAEAACRAALELAPELLQAHFTVGLCCDDTGRPLEAIACFERALAHKPDLPELRFRHARALWRSGQLDLAVDAYKRALARVQNDAALHNGLGLALKDAGQLEQAIACFRKAIAIDPKASEPHSNLVYALSFDPGSDDHAIAREARSFERAHAALGAQSSRAQRPTAEDATRPLRIGYLAPTLRNHVIGTLMLPVLEHHDRRVVTVCSYADDAEHDHVSERLRQHSAEWTVVASLSDAELAARIERDRIDILVDLNMHMGKSRLGVFARRPAPVQMCWLAYPGTTGLTAIDYRISDPHLDPIGGDESCYAERVLRLPDAFWCYAALALEVDPGPLPARANGFVTFGSLNNFCKVSPEVMALWARVLGAVPDSRMAVLVPEGRTRSQLIARFESHGIAPERIEPLSPTERTRYLRYYQSLDLGLDTFPYNGHTTSLDSFHMGVPVLTKAGSTVAGRAGACLAHNLGLPEWIASSDDDFVERAVRFAADLDALESLRASLRERLAASPLMDGKKLTAALEALYRHAWQNAWQHAEPKRGVSVERAVVDEQVVAGAVEVA